MGYFDQRPGVKTITTEGAIGTSDGSGKVFPVRVFAVSVLAGAGTAATITLYDGNNTSGVAELRYHALANSQTTDDIGKGWLFTDGCYVGTAGAGITSISVSHFVEPA